MARPIPVFAFVFAAFAATSVGGQPIDAFAPAQSEPPESRDARDLFLTTWRTLSRHGANLRVRVGVVVEEEIAAPRLAARGHDVEELWLGEIAETRRGFIGVTVTASERLRHIRPGQQISFELGHILGWTLDVEAAANAPARPKRESPANQELS